MPVRIEDYALIGDRHTAALVSRDGSIDWLCVPRFDSPACFAALLGEARNGRWRIAPAGEITSVQRRYRDDTLVLDCEFETADGRVRLTDFMPIGGRNSSVVRLVSGLAGRIPMRMDLTVRFDYGRLIPWVSRADGTLSAISGPHLLLLHASVPHRGEGLNTVADFIVNEGETVAFILTYALSYRESPPPIDPESALRDTESYWKEWSGRCTYDGIWREAVVRSLITLQALTYAPSGGMVAAPTTSIPEQPGGTRNWDYRYCWLRDATWTLLSFMAAGYPEEAEDWRRWLVRAVAGHPSQLQPLYTILGESRIDELDLPWLAGLGGAKPVRVGNAASGQIQLDAFGEVLDALHHARRNNLAEVEAAWALQKTLLRHIETLIDAPDCGIWEVRGGPQHFTHSKVMMWVAFDRAVCAVERHGLDGPAHHWRKLRDALHEEICTRGFSPQIGAFVQSYESPEVDAAALLIPLVGFLPASDPRIIGTLAAIEQSLMVDGFVRRYHTHAVRDGLPPGEGVFLACSFWFADNLILQGRTEEGRRVFERLLAVRNDVGLLAEEYDVETGIQLGNFPQALSHLALVNTAYSLAGQHGPTHERRRHARKS